MTTRTIYRNWIVVRHAPPGLSAPWFTIATPRGWAIRQMVFSTEQAARDYIDHPQHRSLDAA